VHQAGRRKTKKEVKVIPAENTMMKETTSIPDVLSKSDVGLVLDVHY
jgi:hypothetical protein